MEKQIEDIFDPFKKLHERRKQLDYWEVLNKTLKDYGYRRHPVMPFTYGPNSIESPIYEIPLVIKIPFTKKVYYVPQRPEVIAEIFEPNSLDNPVLIVGIDTSNKKKIEKVKEMADILKKGLGSKGIEVKVGRGLMSRLL